MVSRPMLNHTASEELRRHESEPVLVYGSLQSRLSCTETDTTLFSGQRTVGRRQKLIIDETPPFSPKRTSKVEH